MAHDLPTVANSFNCRFFFSSKFDSMHMATAPILVVKLFLKSSMGEKLDECGSFMSPSCCLSAVKSMFCDYYLLLSLRLRNLLI